MSENSNNNPDYHLHHPDAVEDRDLAEMMAYAGDHSRTQARTVRIGSELAIAASRAAEQARREGDAYADAQDYIGDVVDMNGQIPRADDRDLASNISTRDRLQLLSEKGRAELRNTYQKISETADDMADAKEETVRQQHIKADKDPATYQIPVDHR